MRIDFDFLLSLTVAWGGVAAAVVLEIGFGSSMDFGTQPGVDSMNEWSWTWTNFNKE